MLPHPLTGLPDDRFRATTAADETIILSCDGLGATVSLRRHAATPARPHLASAWTAFLTVLAAPTPPSPTPVQESATPA